MRVVLMFCRCGGQWARGGWMGGCSRRRCIHVPSLHAPYPFQSPSIAYPIIIPSSNASAALRFGRRAAYLATCLGFLGGYWLSGWSLRAKNKKLKQKYEKEIAVSKEI